MLLLARKGGQETWLTPLTAHTEVPETFHHRLLEVKVQVRFLKAAAQGMLVQQNQAYCIIPLNGPALG